jgi:hypothetical protein
VTWQLPNKNRELNREFESHPLGSQVGRFPSGSDSLVEFVEKLRDCRGKKAECVAKRTVSSNPNLSAIQSALTYLCAPVA